MIPVNQFILGGSDPLLYPSEKMTNSIDEQIAFLHEIPYVNKIVALNQTDLEVLKESLISLKTK